MHGGPPNSPSGPRQEADAAATPAPRVRQQKQGGSGERGRQGTGGEGRQPGPDPQRYPPPSPTARQLNSTQEAQSARLSAVARLNYAVCPPQRPATLLPRNATFQFMN